MKRGMSSLQKLAACLVLALIPCCVAIDPEYKNRLAVADSHSDGTEVMGLWVSKLRNLALEQRRTLLLKPDGTGRLRIATTGFRPEEYHVAWSHEGGGHWKLMLTKPGARPLRASLRRSGDTLLYHVLFRGSDMHAVFVRADDDAAVERHLRNR